MGLLNLFSKDGPIRTATRPLRRRAKTARWTRNAKAARDRRSAKVIAVTGSSAKSTTVGLLTHILEAHGKTRGQVFRNQLRFLVRTMASLAPDDEFVVVEAGVGAIGEMAPQANILQPDIAIVTLVGIEHYSAFRTREAVATEKGGLVEAVAPGGVAILNADDENVMGMAARTRERIVTFGRSPAADYRLEDARYRFPGPLSVTIEWQGGTETIESALVGEHFALPVLAAFAAAVELGVPLDVIKRRCREFAPLSCRCEIFETDGGPTFLLDTAKSPHETIQLPFRIVEGAPAERKRIVIGHISDYRGASVPKYRGAYQAARAVSDQVIMVGDNAHRHRASDEERAEGRVVEKANTREVYEFIRDTAVPGELILLKGSKRHHLERVALAFKHDVKCWVDSCGRGGSCMQCGLYEFPYAQHRRIRRRQRLQAFFNRLLRRGNA